MFKNADNEYETPFGSFPVECREWRMGQYRFSMYRLWE